jgi:hypothetical protein
MGSRVGNPVVAAGKKKSGRRREGVGVFVSLARTPAKGEGRKEHPP